MAHPFRPAPPGQTHRNAVVGYFPTRYGDYAEAYRRAAGCLTDDAQTGLGLLDQLIYPIGYTYRHALELALKDANLLVESAIQARIRLGLLGPSDGMTFEDAVKELNAHGLGPLAARLKRRLATIEDAEPLDPSVAGAVAAVDAFDEDGQRFRYPFLTRNRGPSFDHQKLGQMHLDVEAIREELEPVLGYLLDGLGAWLLNDIDTALSRARVGELWADEERHLQAEWDADLRDAQAEWDAERRAAQADWESEVAADEEKWRRELDAEMSAEMLDDGDDP